MNTIFTFWEPREAIIPYLALCMKTWSRIGHAGEIVVLNHANLRDYVGDALDLELLRRVPLPLQKDAAMVAVLHRHGGVFLDADTLAVRDVGPLLALLQGTEVVIFALHLAVMAARPQAELLTRWLAIIRDRLGNVRAPKVTGRAVRWDYLGNSVLYHVMEDIIRRDPDKRPPATVLELGIRAGERLVGAVNIDGAERGLARRAVNWTRWRRRAFYFRTRYRRYFTSLDRARYGFMPELLVRPRPPGLRGAADLYRWYWFESTAGVETALRDRQMVIGLHNSATPSWYKQLSEREVLAHPCLLSRTLCHLLDA